MINGTPVIAFTSHKPGVGKTTAAFLLCYWWATQGKTITYADADHTSQSGSTWQRKADKRGGTKIPFNRISVAHAGLVDEVSEQHHGEDLIGIDVGGGDRALSSLAVSIADIVVIATTMSPFDSEHVPAMSDEIDAALALSDRSKNDIEKLVLFGRYDRRRANAKDRLKAAFNKRGLDVVDNALPDLVDYENVKNHHPGDYGLDMSDVKKLATEFEEILW